MLQEKFPKGYSFKEDSKYKDEIKQKKKINRPKVQGNTLKLKPKEVLERTFRDLGNPVSFENFYLSDKISQGWVSVFIGTAAKT